MLFSFHCAVCVHMLCYMLVTVVTMYLGAEEPRAEMPAWAKSIVLAFGGWRLLADIVLTSVDCYKGKSYV